MTAQTEQEHALATLIVETLNLEDLDPSSIEPEEPLFGDGLGLDSIDALELALAISQRYSVQLKGDDESVKQAFGTLRSMNDFIQKNSA